MSVDFNFESVFLSSASEDSLMVWAIEQVPVDFSFYFFSPTSQANALRNVWTVEIAKLDLILCQVGMVV